jgi:L-lactate utilization protein LutC
LPSRGSVGYQGGGGDLVQYFVEQLTAAGGVAHLVTDAAAAAAEVMGLLDASNVKRILLGRGPVLDLLRLGPNLLAAGKELLFADSVQTAGRDMLYTAELGISGVDYLIAETGTIVVAARPGDPRSVSLLPPIHIAVASVSQIVPDLFDLFETTQLREEEALLPSCLTLITGPSKTGDIELKLVTGVHGPGEVHVVLIR